MSGNKTKDIILILGGSKQHSRVLRTEKLLKHLPDSWDETKIIVSGRGTYHLKVDKTEAQKMQETLIEDGIPKESILKEEKAMDTMGNMVFSYEIVEDLLKNQEEKTRIFLVTSGSHMTRAEFLFRKVFHPLKSKLSYYFIKADHSLPNQKELGVMGFYMEDFKKYPDIRKFVISLPVYDQMKEFKKEEKYDLSDSYYKRMLDEVLEKRNS